MLSCFVVMVLMIGKAHLQTVRISAETSTPYKCGGTLVLKCAVSGSPACCSDTRTWTKNGINLNTVSNSKYVEELNPGSSFSLTINDLSKSDVGATYGCLFSLSTVSTIKVDSSIICHKCGIWGFLWNCIGDIIGWLPFVIIKVVFLFVIRQTVESRVAFRCKYKAHKGNGLRWDYSSSGLDPWTAYSSNANIANVEAKPRITITGNNEAGEYILNIKDLKESDSGYYRCTVGGSGEIYTKQLIVKESFGWIWVFCDIKRFCKTSVISLICSLIVGTLVAVLVNIYCSLCLATQRLDYLFILLGILEVIFFILVAYVFHHCSSDAATKNCSVDTNTESRPLKKKIDKNVKSQDDADTEPSTPTAQTDHGKEKFDSMQMTSENEKEKKN